MRHRRQNTTCGFVRTSVEPDVADDRLRTDRPRGAHDVLDDSIVGRATLLVCRRLGTPGRGSSAACSCHRPPGRRWPPHRDTLLVGGCHSRSLWKRLVRNFVNDSGTLAYELCRGCRVVTLGSPTRRAAPSGPVAGPASFARRQAAIRSDHCVVVSVVFLPCTALPCSVSPHSGQGFLYR